MMFDTARPYGCHLESWFSRRNRAQQFNKVKATGVSSGVGNFSTPREVFPRENLSMPSCVSIEMNSLQWMSTISDTAGEPSIRAHTEHDFLFETSLKVGFASSISFGESVFACFDG